MYFNENINQTFYHGTSSNLPIQNIIYPPSITEILRENRSKYMNVVFFTTSKLSAIKYAMKQVKKYGGRPVIYLVKPDSESITYNKGANEYFANYCTVLGKLPIV